MTDIKDSIWLKHATLVAVLATTLLMLLAGTVFYEQNRIGNETKKWVIHTYVVTRHIQRLFHKVKDVELGQRGYLLTGEDSYLTPYRQALDKTDHNLNDSSSVGVKTTITDELNILKGLTQDNSAQQKNLDGLSTAIGDLMSYWTTTMAPENIQSSHDPAAMKSKIDISNALMDHIRDLTSTIASEENQLLAQRVQMDSEADNRNLILIMGGVGAFYFIMLGYIWLYHKLRKRAQADAVVYTRELEQREENLRSAMEHAPIGMCIVSCDENKWVRVNQALCKIIGYSEAELLATNIDTISYPEDLPTSREYRSRLMRREIDSYQIEKRYRHKEGHPIWVSLSVSLMIDITDKPSFYIAQIEDITDRREADALRKKLMEKLSVSNLELERFAYIASHDMQEPLRMITNFGNLLAEEYNGRLDKDGQQYLDIMTSASSRMQALVSDLLEYARLGHEAVRFTTVDTAQEFRHVLENLSQTIADYGAVVSQGTLPVISANPVQFMSLMQNLVGNGLKYQKADTKPQIAVNAEETTDAWLFSVKDNGIGIKPEYARKIFEPFKRLHSWQQYHGTGIGLAVCKKIVENHGGKIWVTSEPGHGSCFYFTISKMKGD